MANSRGKGRTIVTAHGARPGRIYASCIWIRSPTAVFVALAVPAGSSTTSFDFRTILLVRHVGIECIMWQTIESASMNTTSIVKRMKNETTELQGWMIKPVPSGSPFFPIRPMPRETGVSTLLARSASTVSLLVLTTRYAPWPRVEDEPAIACS